MKQTKALILALVFMVLCLSGCQFFNLDSNKSGDNKDTIESVDSHLDSNEDVNSGDNKITGALPEKMPERFRFSINWYIGASRKYDSDTGRLVKSHKEGYTTTYIMPEKQLEEVYNLIYNLNIERYGVVELSKSSYEQGDPGEDFYLTVEGMNIYSRVITATAASGTDAGKDSQAKNYFKTVKAIIDILENTDEWKALPEDSSDSSVTPALPEQMPDDFRFKVKWGSIGSSYDSLTGELRKAWGEEYTTTYIMPEEKLKAAYKLIYELNIENYDDDICILEYSSMDPSFIIELAVYSSDIDKTITANSTRGFSSGKSDRVRRYFSAVEYIVNVLEATDEWRALPDFKEIID